MKETGIIMSGDHPRKILDGAKTMTRRTWGLEEINKDPDNWKFVYKELDTFYFEPVDKHCIAIMIKCPYGQVGDRLWVRETYAVRADGVDQILYKADYEALTELLELPHIDIRWKPSIFMFRKDSRIPLEITGLRAERLQNITEEDAKAEGGYSVEEYIKKFIELNHLPEDANPWNWVIPFARQHQ